MKIQSLFLHLSKKIFFYRWPILSGILIGTSYIPFPPWAVLFCLVPLFIFWSECRTFKQAFWGGWWTGFILTLIGFNWVAHLAHEFGHFPWALSLLTLLLFAAIGNVYYALTGGLWFLCKKRIHSNLLLQVTLMALIFALFETFYFFLFKWNFGYTLLWMNLNSAQIAEWIGFQGLSSLIVLSNILSFYIWKYRKGKKGALLAFALLSIWLGLEGVGAFLKGRLPEPDAKLKVLVTQANIGNLEKVYSEKGWGFRDHVVSKYFDLTEEAIVKENASHPNEKIDFIVWPETAFPESLSLSQRSKKHSSLLMSFIKKQNIPLITGGYGYDGHQAKTTNSIFFFDSTATDFAPPYNKEILLAFGEYIPFAETFPILEEWIPAGDFARGSGPKVVDFQDFKIGPFICYEGLYPNYIRQLGILGAHILVNSTNDSWYGTWMEPYQHGYMTLARAIELRRPLIRSTNTGISTVVLADGTILNKSPLNKEWTHIYNIPFHKKIEATLYQQHYWMFPGFMIILFLTLFVRGWVVKLKDH